MASKGDERREGEGTREKRHFLPMGRQIKVGQNVPNGCTLPLARSPSLLRPGCAAGRMTHLEISGLGRTALHLGQPSLYLRPCALITAKDCWPESVTRRVEIGRVCHAGEREMARRGKKEERKAPTRDWALAACAVRSGSSLVPTSYNTTPLERAAQVGRNHPLLRARTVAGGSLGSPSVSPARVPGGRVLQIHRSPR